MVWYGCFCVGIMMCAKKQSKRDSEETTGARQNSNKGSKNGDIPNSLGENGPSTPQWRRSKELNDEQASFLLNHTSTGRNTVSDHASGDGNDAITVSFGQLMMLIVVCAVTGAALVGGGIYYTVGNDGNNLITSEHGPDSGRAPVHHGLYHDDTMTRSHHHDDDSNHVANQERTSPQSSQRLEELREQQQKILEALEHLTLERPQATKEHGDDNDDDGNEENDEVPQASRQVSEVDKHDQERNEELERVIGNTKVAERIVIDKELALNGPERLYYLKGMLSRNESEYLLEYAQPFFKPSETMGKTSRTTRDSQSAFIEETHADPIIKLVSDKMHKEAAMPTKYGEVLQLTKYSQHQKYEFHFDSSMEVGRLVTVLVFLEDIPEGYGGETVFPHARVKPSQREKVSSITGITLPPVGDPSWDDSRLPEVGTTHNFEQPSMQQFCDHPRVLRFRPRQGDALMWFNHDPELLLDPSTVHGGCPIKADSQGYAPNKTIAQRWIRYYRGTNEFVGVLKDCGVL